MLTGRTIAEQDRFQEYRYQPVRMEVVTEDKVDLNRLIKFGGVITGGGGVGKTEFIKTICQRLTTEQRKKTVVLSYVNAAVENLRERLKAFPVTIQTVSGYLWNGGKPTADALAGCELVILDEFMMLPPTEMGLLLIAQARYGTNVICLGDPEQCKAPEDNWVDYMTNPAFLRMCDEYHVRMVYKPGFARYDTGLYESLKTLLDTDKLQWECDVVDSYVNICYTNNKRAEIHAACLARWVAEHNATLTTFGFSVCVGLPVMAYDDANKELGIYKTQVWFVKSIADDQIFLEREGKTVYLNKAGFRRMFKYSFAMTVHKCQSITIKGHYNIYEADMMTKDVLYTAMSRGTHKSHVHIARKRNWVYPKARRPLSIEIQLEPIKLMTGRIYRIRLSNGCEYIGKTVKQLSGYKYILVVVDVLSRFAWCRPLKNKDAKQVWDALQSVMDESGKKPSSIWVDKGTEFYNGLWTAKLKALEIDRYSTMGLTSPESPSDSFRR